MTPTLGDVKNAATEGLPAKFVLSMRTLFDILDDKRTGYVKFSGDFVFLYVKHLSCVFFGRPQIAGKEEDLSCVFMFLF